jgi:homoserine dehydrogenase
VKLIRIGVLGCGNVGAPLVALVAQQQAAIEARTGVRLEVVSVAVRNLSKQRDIDLPDGMLTRDAMALVTDPSIDLIVELIGGIEPARELITTALRNGKPVVTGNKELLANVGAELFAVADEAGVDLLFEAAVAGGIPIVRALRESLRGEPIRRVMGIINGTTNFILTKMTEEGADYSVALAEAQALGFAERDPTADVEGYDAGAKAAIMATIAFGSRVVAGDVYHEASAASRPPTSRWRSGWATSSSCWASPKPTTPEPSAYACTPPWCRSPTRSPACAKATTQCSWRAPRSAR